MSRKIQKWSILFTVFVAAFIVWCTYFKKLKFENLTAQMFKSSKLPINSCPDVASGMMRGRWRSRPLTPEEETEIDTFLTTARRQHSIPPTLQRNDGRCGKVAFETLFWFRALCNPKGLTPCCYHGNCVSKSPDECRCEDCYDTRHQVHAEYSSWDPEDLRCNVANFTSTMACELLQNRHLNFVGDSLMRHLYTALLLILSNDRERGSLTADAPNHCRGMFTFTEKVCRLHLNRNTTICNGNVHVNIYEYYNLQFKKKFLELFKNKMHKQNSVFMVGIGYHDSFNYERVYNEFILPVILKKEKEHAKWPLVIWATNHKFGLLKTPYKPQQDNDHIQTFNKYMSENLQQHNVPIFDTYNVTSGVVSQDGSHYGIALNLMKAQMFLNYLLELKDKGQF